MIPIGVVVWVLGSLLIGIAGRRYRFGFWGYFFVSILLPPVVGLLMWIAAVPPRSAKRLPRR